MMKEYPTWDKFKAKYSSIELQRARFEDLARALFCRKYGVKYGLFQFANHAGNETETIADGADIIGFQAKFFEKDIDAKQIIHSLQISHVHQPNQTKVLVYTNLTFGNPPKGQSVTNAQRDVQIEAQKLNMDIEWVTDKMILDQVAPTDWIYDVFFNNEPNLQTYYGKEKKNTERIFQNIYSAIEFGDKIIKINRDSLVSELENGIRNHEHFVISGDGGCGKTAVVKDLYEKVGTEIPFCIRKAISLNKDDVDDFFSGYTLGQFENVYTDEDIKVFVIDSAERIQDITDTSALINLVKDLKIHGWSIIFTSRSLYSEDLCNELRYTYNLNFTCVSINTITEAELEACAEENQIMLPPNEGLRELLCTLFYLHKYVQYGEGFQFEGTSRDFINQVWEKTILGECKKDGNAIDRENCFFRIIRDRISQDSLYLDKENYDGQPLYGLMTAEVIAESEQGIYIAHDIYEEWGVLRIIEKEWRKKKGIADFFLTIGTSYVVRRTFRQWLSDKIDHSVEDVRVLLSIERLDGISPLWKDEILVSVLHSTYCEAFLTSEHELLLKDDAKLYKRLVFLLKLACKQIRGTYEDSGNAYPLYAPNGYGWKEVIDFTYQHKEHLQAIPNLHEVLLEWCTYNYTSETTRKAGMLALDAIEREEQDKDYWLKPQEYREQLYRIVCFAASEVCAELKEILDKIVQNKWKHHGNPYYKFVQFLLTKQEMNGIVVQCMPNQIMQLCELYWMQDADDIKKVTYQSPLERNNEFGLREEEGRRYVVVGALQTPIYRLLQFSTVETLRFIVNLINRCVATYSNVPNNDLVKLKLHLDDEMEVDVWSSYSLWELYRGATQIVMPDLLQCLHMGLEKYLLDVAEKRPKDASLIMDFLLRVSKSVSLTAVVASAVTAYPERFPKQALVLFRTIEFFRYDSMRCQMESQRGLFLGYDMMRNKKVAEERIKSNALPHRKHTLEDICVNYQYVRTELTEDESREQVNEIHHILDTHYANLANRTLPELDALQTLLCRIDRRKHAPKVQEQEGQILIDLRPQIPEDVKKRNDDVLRQIAEETRYDNLYLWANKKFRKEEVSCCGEYDKDLGKVFLDLEGLCERLSSGNVLSPMEENIPFMTAGVLIRDEVERLTEEQLDACRQLVEYQMENLPQLPMISDGMESCVHALPNLIRKFPQNKNRYSDYLTTILRNRYPLGEYKRVCDYAIETIHEGNLWIDERALMNQLLSEYIAENDMTDIESNEIVLELLPYTIEDAAIEEQVLAIIPYLGSAMTPNWDRKYYRNWHFCEAFAHYVLHQPVDKIDRFITPILPYLQEGSEVYAFLVAFVGAEDKVQRYDAFWMVWKLIYDVVINISIDGDAVMRTYLLVDKCAVGNAKMWHSFRDENLWLFEHIVRDKGEKPVVLYSVVKALDTFANAYVDRGIEWIHESIEKSKGNNRGDYDAITVFLLEQLLSKYIQTNKCKIKSQNLLRMQLIDILTFMAERNSVHAYMMREKL